MREPVAGINPAMLVWARNRSGQSIEEVAKALGKEPAVIEGWEAGTSSPTYPQLEDLAYKVYKRPVALFFFPEPPDESSLSVVIKGRVHNGRLVVDEPTELPEGTEVDLLLLDPGDWLDPADRAALQRALMASQEDIEAGRFTEAERVLRQLRTPRTTASKIYEEKFDKR